MILVSEIMSQQTQIMRVVPKFAAWMEELPTVESLAHAPVSSVLRLWSGLGYNRRALFLQKAAQEIVRSHNGIFPHTVEDLKKLPGVGDYTAAAVACFAFNLQIPVIDTNIRKVILTQFPDCHCEELETTKQSVPHQRDCHASLAMTEKEIEEIARLLLPEEKARDWNQALMDFAASELKKYKIPLPKQSKLLGSDRYYRGQIIKQLLRAQGIGERLTVEKMHAYFSNQGQKVEKERLERILSCMEKEGFVIRQNDVISLAD
jgi:A/G-specific adenine glycosylase